MDPMKIKYVRISNFRISLCIQVEQLVWAQGSGYCTFNCSACQIDNYSLFEQKIKGVQSAGDPLLAETEEFSELRKWLISLC